MRRLAAIAALVLLSTVVGPSALADSTNLLTNGDFEASGGSLTGWKGQSSTLTLVTGDGGGSGAHMSRTGTAGSFGIITTTNPVNGTAQAGAVYTANGRFNAPSKSVCLKIKETGSQTATDTSCANGTGAWATLPQLQYTALADGDSLTFSVIQKNAANGDAFSVDNLSLTASGVTSIDPPSNLTANVVSSGEIDLQWDPSGTAGITGYHVFRNGGSQPVATVNAPDTTYADTNVNAGTSYTYTVDAFDANGESAMSNQASATTPGGAGSVTIAAAGDIACNPNDPDYNGGNGQNGHCMQKATANLIGQGSYDKVLPLGDLQYDCGSLNAFNAVYDGTWGQYDGKMEPVLGNHEVKGSSSAGETGCSSKATGYFTYFSNHGVTDAAGVNGKGYYSYNVGAWHLIAINSNCNQAGGCDTGSPQMTWIQNDLAAHPTQCTLAYWHEAAWSTTGNTSGVTDMRPIWAVLANAGVDLVLSGHFHHYERFSDLNASGKPVADGTGMREIIAGIGGESQGSFGSKTPLAGSQVRKTGYGILALTLNSGSYSWQYRQVGGSVADQGTDTCH
ncbi:MAG TPA: fibronectin type III domain-containing protein [Gaiellales bacterium]|jgi:hypothetical protein|nr:fibronectin type III domain-containing protein [Gaiellales bacterium]